MKKIEDRGLKVLTIFSRCSKTGKRQVNSGLWFVNFEYLLQLFRIRHITNNGDKLNKFCTTSSGLFLVNDR